MSTNTNTRFVAAQLRRLPLFARLTPEQLERAAAIAQVVRAEPNMLLARQGQPASALYLFVSGRGILTRVTPNGAEEQVAVVNEGQYVGEAALYSERIEPYNLRALEGALVLVVPKQGLAMVISQSPEVRANIGMQPEATRDATRIFKGQREDETVRHIFKRHWWSFVRITWVPLLLATLMIIGAVLLLPSNATFAFLLFGMAVLLPGGLAGLLYADWQDDVLVITDQRIVKIYDNFFKMQKSVNEIPYERAHEINTEIPADPFSRIFNYGTVVIKTAGAAGTIWIDTLPNPERIQKLIFDEREQHMRGTTAQQQEAINRQIDAAIGVPGAGIQTPAPSRRVVEGAAAHAASEGSLNPLRTRYVDGEGATVYRRHLSSWLRGVTLPLAVMIASVLVGFGGLAAPIVQTLGITATLVAGAVFLFGCLWFYLADWDWRHDKLIVGDETITIIHKRPLWLQNEVEQIRLAQVDNVISEVIGLVNSILNRGTIRISLIGGDAQDAKRFSDIGDPQSVQGEISRRLARLQSEQAEGDAQRQQQAIADYLAAYHQRVSGQPQGYTPNVQPYATPPQPYTPPNAPEPPDAPPPQIRDGSRPPNVPRVRGE
jgi:membrane protein YdbS with pleckstrin-like domain